MDLGHEIYMARALELAREAWGKTHPNPMVGALLVEEGKVVAEGFHARSGEAHAEIACLNNLSRKPNPCSILYVTLEPCSTRGRTGACTDAIAKSGIRKVIIGCKDPNPLHAGKGLSVLEKAGVDVTCGVLESECEDLNLIFNHYITKGSPLLAGKTATTIDGKVATRTGHSKWITSEEARNEAHTWRRIFPAIACGSGTLLSDNPSLTARIEGQKEWCPRRFIFDRSLSDLGDFNYKVFSDEHRGQTTIVTSEQANPNKITDIQNHGIGIWQLAGAAEQAFFEAFINKCNDAGICGVLFEGGPRLLSSLLVEQKLNYFFAYRAPRLFADSDALSCVTGQETLTVKDSIEVTKVKHATLGQDQLMRGFINYHS